MCDLRWCVNSMLFVVIVFCVIVCVCLCKFACSSRRSFDVVDVSANTINNHFSFIHKFVVTFTYHLLLFLSSSNLMQIINSDNTRFTTSSRK